MTTQQLPPLPEQSMTHHITDEQIDELCLSLTGTYTRKERDRAVARALLALAAPAPQGEPFGWWFTEDPAVFSAPGSGFRRYPDKPQHTVECIALYTAPAPAVPEDVARDAERYRTIRSGRSWPCAFASSDAPEPLTGDDLDAAIDAARAAEKGGA